MEGLTKDDVLAVEVRGGDSSDEELRSIRARASIRHGEETRLSVLDLEVLVYPTHVRQHPP